MILDERKYGSMQFRGSEFKLIATYHTHDARGSSSIPRDSLTKAKYESIITQADAIKPIKLNIPTGIVWKHSNGFFRGIIVLVENSTIRIITTILSKNKTSYDVFRKRFSEDNIIFIDK